MNSTVLYLSWKNSSVPIFEVDVASKPRNHAPHGTPGRIHGADRPASPRTLGRFSEPWLVTVGLCPNTKCLFGLSQLVRRGQGLLPGQMRTLVFNIEIAHRVLSTENRSSLLAAVVVPIQARRVEERFEDREIGRLTPLNLDDAAVVMGTARSRQPPSSSLSDGDLRLAEAAHASSPGPTAT